MSEFVTRFAPSPTGYLHLGHAFSALIAFDAATKINGRFILRIEDIDLGRCKAEFEQAIYDDLQWLGLRWEQPVRRQSDHFAEYTTALEKLRSKEVVYRCFKTRKEITDEIARAPHLAPEGPEGAPYIGARPAVLEESALLAEGKAYAWRISIQRAKEVLGSAYDGLSFVEQTDQGSRTIAATPDIFGDIVVARKDFGTSYHLSSAHDDALQGITHIIRGTDLYHAAHLHVLLQTLLDYPTPIYQHHRLITDESGSRLAKRNKSATIKSLRESGVTPQEIRTQLGL